MKLLTFIVCLVFFGYSQQLKLDSYNVDLSKITVSGFSSGAAMAIQLQVAFSANITGLGVVSGLPYLCSGGDVNKLAACKDGLDEAIPLEETFKSVQNYVETNQIDDTENLKNSQIYIFHGKLDFILAQKSVQKNEEFFKNYVKNPSQIKGIYSYEAVHAFITNNYGTPCSTVNYPFLINNCNYNQAYDLLRHLYGLSIQEPSKTFTPTQSLIEFDQTEFFPFGKGSKISMDNDGFIYVPEACRNGETLHGCTQGKYALGDFYATKTGYNAVADLNKIIVIHPQAKSTLMTNPNGCWDAQGFTGPEFATKYGLQMQAIKSMIDRVAGV